MFDRIKTLLQRWHEIQEVEALSQTDLQDLGLSPWTILIPGAFLAVTVLAVNLLGDGLRDRLDPRLARRL